LEDLIRQEFSFRFLGLNPNLDALPIDLNAGRFHGSNRCVSDLRTDTVAWNERDPVRHVS
jgi:hypothetical protein